MVTPATGWCRLGPTGPQSKLETRILGSPTHKKGNGGGGKRRIGVARRVAAGFSKGKLRATGDNRCTIKIGRVRKNQSGGITPFPVTKKSRPARGHEWKYSRAWEEQINYTGERNVRTRSLGRTVLKEGKEPIYKSRKTVFQKLRLGPTKKNWARLLGTVNHGRSPRANKKKLPFALQGGKGGKVRRGIASTDREGMKGGGALPRGESRKNNAEHRSLKKRSDRSKGGSK